MVVVADVQDDLGNQVAASIGTHRCTFLHCDVTDEDQVKSLVQSTIYNHGQLDIMFSNAGILSPAEQNSVHIKRSCQQRSTESDGLRHVEACRLGFNARLQRAVGRAWVRVNCVSPNGLATPMTCTTHGNYLEEVQQIYGRFARLGVLTPQHMADAVLSLMTRRLLPAMNSAVDGRFTYGK
ncbi:hypothetical protein AHAS_Ahas05G0268600 [Arachis hypogaea]